MYWLGAAVENSRTDELVKDNLATTELGVRSYLGVPLHKNGYVLGSLCVIDMKPRTWTDEDVASLRVLADEVMSKM